MQDIADDLIKLYAERQATPGYAFEKDTPEQREFEEMFPYDETRDQLRAIEEIKKDMEKNRPMDLAALRRRRLRQNRGGDPRGLQGGDGGQAGSGARSDDDFGAAALRNVPRTFFGISDQHPGAQPLPFPEGAERDDQGRPPRDGRRCHRHASPVVPRSCIQGPWTVDRRRRAAFWRDPQGEAQKAENERGRADVNGNTDSAHAAYVDAGRSRSVGHRDAAGEPFSGANLRGGAQPDAGAGGDRTGAWPRGPGLLSLQPGAGHSGNGEPDQRAGA